MSAVEAIEAYYKLKGAYEAKRNRLKQRILKSDDSKAEKRLRFEALRIPCVGCKRKVGSIFYTMGRNLIARCGDDDAPCNFKIEIDRGEYSYSPHLLETIQHDIEVAKMDIIKSKLGLLFGFIEENSMIETFETLKDNYKGLQHYINLIEKDMRKGQFIDVQEPGSSGRRISKMELAKINQMQLGHLINRFRDLMTHFSSSEEAANQKFLQEAIELYVQEIIPILHILRQALYDICTVVYQDRQFYLVQIKIKLENLIMELEAPHVITNEK
ncbi:MAG: hypothetical protein V3W20_14600 [Candidatus Neomarinimicrobiota bacterium]